MSDTPRTDSEVRRIEKDEKEYPDLFDCYEALIKWSRTLERELAAAIRERDNAQSVLQEAEEALCQVSGLITGINPGDGEGTTYGEIIEQVVRLKGERDDWKACAEALAVLAMELSGDGATQATEHPALARFRELKSDTQDRNQMPPQ